MIMQLWLEGCQIEEFGDKEVLYVQHRMVLCKMAIRYDSSNDSLELIECNVQALLCPRPRFWDRPAFSDPD